MRRVLLPVAGALSILAVVAAGTGPAAAVPLNTAPVSTAAIPGGFASWDELFAVQQRMDAALERIDAVVRAGGYRGFGNAIAAPETHRLRIFWKGKVPAAVEQVVAEQRKNIPIDVLPARFSHDEAARTMAKLSAYNEFVELSENPDATGVTAKVRGAAVSAAADKTLRAAEASVTVMTGEGGSFATSGRQNDSPPYYAGARMVGQSPGSACTVGFAVSFYGRDMLFTAGHCVMYTAPDNSQKVYDGGGDLIGGVFRDNNTRDIALIEGPSWGRVWDGPANSTVSKPVQSAVTTANGNWVCASGATLGIRCGIQVISNNTSPRDKETGEIRTPMVMARRMDGQAAVGDGDSGGPVFSLPSPDNGKVIGKGIISAGGVEQEVVTCPAGTDWWIECSRVIYFADLKTSMGVYGLTIKTA